MIEATLSNWAISLGRAEATILTRLSKRGIKYQKHQKFTAKEIFSAMSNEKDEAVARKAVAEAEGKEMENELMRGNITKKQDVEHALWDDLLLPLRQKLQNMPGAIAAQCNPEKPQMAFNVIQSHIDGIKRDIVEPNKTKEKTK